MDTDTDTDMEIPLPEELELLESNYHLEEDYLDLEPPEPYPEEEQEPSPPPAASPISDPPLHSEAQINSHKRLRSDDPGVSNLEKLGLSEDKRSRIDKLVTEPEEDWLRYSPPQENNSVVAEQVNFEKEKILSRFVSEIDGDCIAVTAPDGDRVYAKICRVGKEERLKKLDVKAHSGVVFLYDSMMLRWEVLFWNPSIFYCRDWSKRLSPRPCKPVLNVGSDIIPPETPIVHEKLWVDKYAPNSFTELLSDEQTNREVLLWLKQWDSCVFGSEIRSTSDEVLSALKRHSSVAQRQKPLDLNFLMKNGGPRWNYGRSRHSKIMDENEHKILLLCGPPGLGKTTLAHVAAKHCGYHVVEVNASDDRSSSSIEAKILDVVQMNSVMSDSRPKCLVIDEIDGALGDGKGAVEVILRW
ncbi:chromosome transmission fidelity protein 18-like [Quillaja saponaria]|uniref:Chromosome transmission fidelity protein 18-like n=1 Tax=Quillaja saponaria TaxID=32244 RepID=A0AAD7QDT1_QUISA|nr:chromosome transmission fidelity protein 18-like [Quillaja saponaria]